MEFLKDLRLRLHYKGLLKEVAKRKPAVGRGAVTWKNAKQIGVLFNADEPAARKQILKYADALRKKGKQVRILGFLTEAQEGQEFAFRTFSKKDIDWQFRPKGEEVQAFMQQSFDLMFHLGLQPDFQLEYIAALSNAKLRIGPPTEHTYAYDLMIDVPASAGLQGFIAQMESLLGKTNTPYEPANAS